MWECISEMLGVVFIFLSLYLVPIVVLTLCIGILMIIRSLFR